MQNTFWRLKIAFLRVPTCALGPRERYLNPDSSSRVDLSGEIHQQPALVLCGD